MIKLTELNGVLDRLATQLDKAKTEIVTEVQALQNALAGVEVPADAQASLERLGVLAQALDDLNPDPVPPVVPVDPVLATS